MLLPRAGRKVIFGLSLVLSILFAGNAMAGVNDYQTRIANGLGTGCRVDAQCKRADSKALWGCILQYFQCTYTVLQMTESRTDPWVDGAYFDYTIWQSTGSEKPIHILNKPRKDKNA